MINGFGLAIGNNFCGLFIRVKMAGWVICDQMAGLVIFAKNYSTGYLW